MKENKRTARLRMRRKSPYAMKPTIYITVAVQIDRDAYEDEFGHFDYTIDFRNDVRDRVANAVDLCLDEYHVGAVTKWPVPNPNPFVKSKQRSA